MPKKENIVHPAIAPRPDGSYPTPTKFFATPWLALQSNARFIFQEIEMTHQDLRRTIRDEVGPMFEATHEIMRAGDNKVRSYLKTIIETESHRTRVMIEQLISKVDLALDQSNRVGFHESVLPDHESRINRLETDVKVIKLALGKNKS
jgi:hypothetical protein